MSELDRKGIDNLLAFHSAPTLLGVKCANLISIDRNEHTIKEYFRDFTIRTHKEGFRARELCKCRQRTLIYIYNEKMLNAWLNSPRVREFLDEYGYAECRTTDEMLDILAGRIICGRFPHEIGAFLGYPVEDIRGFISNSGKNCLLCGYWKVYGNAEKARQTFETYDRCRETLFDRLKTGLDLFQAISKEENI